jgi:4-amino-4-deoxy-L-arabinose transferase-like glycosyltransferase
MNAPTNSGDRQLACAFGVLVVAVLFVTAPSIGYARDEGFYFQAATQYAHWLEQLVSAPEQAIQRPAVDAAFRINAEHPSLMKLLFALSHRVLHDGYHVIKTPGLSFRFPGMLMAGLAAGLVVLWGSRAVSRWAGVIAGLLFITLPRVFHHAHLACFDVPVAATILLTVFAYFQAMTSRSTPWAIATGLCYGLALDTKHNAWSLPAVLFLHWLMTEGRAFLGASRGERWRSLLPLLAMLLLGPLVLWLLWPWLWYDTAERVHGWIQFHLRHDYYNMEFLGRTYHRPPMPRGYAWVMTLATVPFTTLLLAGIGCFVSVRHGLRNAQRRRRVDDSPSDAKRSLAPAPWDTRSSTDALWLLCLLAAYAPWWFTTTPIFGGTKHWLTAYPFLCLFAARGFGVFAARLREHFTSLPLHSWRWRALAASASVLCVLAPLGITADSLPFGLSAYTPLVGGAPGAASLGLNRTFWGYTSLEMADEMQQLLPRGGSVFVHDTALQSWDMHRQDGTFDPKLRPTLSIPNSSLALYHYEPHMGRVEYQIWEAYGTTTPEAVTTFDGVPVMWLYARPEVANATGGENKAP